MSKRQRRERAKQRRHLSGGSSAARRVALTGGATLGATLAMGGVADAATFTVTNNNDSGPGSLRAAVGLANLSPGADTVNFAPGVTGTITLSGGAITVSDSLNIQGPGAGALTITDPTGHVFDFATALGTQQSSISGLSFKNSKSALYADGSSALTVSDSVLSGNNGAGNTYGAIYTGSAALTVIRSVISGNHGLESGGGIQSSGPTMIQDSTISGNTDGNRGGGISAGGPLTIKNSTISGNTAQGVGGGVYAYDTLTVQNSTVSGNTGTKGGGIYAHTDLTITDSTVSGNHAAGSGAAVRASLRALLRPSNEGGGIFMFKGSPYPVGTLQDTIVSGNTSVVDPDVSGLFRAAFSLIQNPGTASITDAVAGSNIKNQDPLLGPLQNNGGPTQTMLPSPSSPVINKGNSEGLSTDQRGFARPMSFPGVAFSAAAGADGADMGAVELQVPVAVTNAASGLTGSAATLNGSVNPENVATTYQFQYGTSTAYGSTTASQPLGATDASAHAVSAAISGLAPNTTYHFRVLATNTDGATSYGADMTFTTPALPVAITGPANHVGAGSATVTGSVNPDGLSTQYDFQYGLTVAYGSQSATQTLPAGSTAVSVSAVLHGLHPGKTYHYRVAAVNAGGVSYGADKTFKDPLPQTGVLGFSSRACVATTANARVNINDSNRLKSLTVRIDGHAVLHTTHAHFSLKPVLAHLGPGRHTLQISGTDSTGARFTRTLPFTRCHAPNPTFTG